MGATTSGGSARDLRPLVKASTTSAPTPGAVQLLLKEKGERVPERYEKPLIKLIIVGCLLFNYVLCVLNTHLISVSDKHVIGAELLLMTAAWGVLMWGGKRLQVGWLCLALAFVVIPVFVMILREQPMPKTVRDIIIVPTFVLLGMRYGRHNLSGFVVALCALVFFVAFIEASFVDQYQQYVDVIGYYISKGAASEGPMFLDTRLYVSAIRLAGRMFGSFLGDLRASSIFLEPVSLGMFAAIVSCYALAAGDEITRGRRMACLAFAVVFVVLCDGRLAFGLVILALAARFILFRLPKIVLFLYLPLAMGIALLLQIILPFTPQGDNLLGRINNTATLLRSMTLDIYLGLSPSALPTVDSGIAYLIERVGLIGVAIFWCALCALCQYNDRVQRTFAHTVCLYLSISWLVSYATFTIKTAAFLWFLFGTFQAGQKTSVPGRIPSATRAAFQHFRTRPASNIFQGRS
jgi:putative polymerase